MIGEISKLTGKNLTVTNKIFNETKQLPQYICQDEKSKEYIVAMGCTNSTNEFINNTINGVEVLEPIYGDYYKFNKPSYTGHIDKYNSNFVIYEYFKNAKRSFALDTRILQIAKAVYSSKSKRIKINKETIDIIANKAVENVFSSSQLAAIKSTVYFENYKKTLAKYDEINIMSIHTDYHQINTLLVNGERYLIDFESFAEFQVASYDWYHLLRSHNVLNSKISTEIPYIDCCESLWNLHHLPPIGNVPLPEFSINENKITMLNSEINYQFTVKFNKNKITVDLQETMISPNFINRMCVELCKIYHKSTIKIDNSICMFCGAKLKDSKYPLYSGVFTLPLSMMFLKYFRRMIKGVCLWNTAK